MIVFGDGCLDRIADAAERAYPEECCGLLVGRREGDGTVSIAEVVESTNLATEQRTRRFEIDPALRLAVMRRLRGTDDEIVGHYHSHPEGAAAPSAYDEAMMFEPELIWLVVAVAGGRAGTARCWRWDATAGCFQLMPHRSRAAG